MLLRRSGVRGGCCCEGDSVLLVLGRVRVVTLHNWDSADPHEQITHTGVMCVIYLCDKNSGDAC